jgi:hypothetical protein
VQQKDSNAEENDDDDDMDEDDDEDDDEPEVGSSRSSNASDEDEAASRERGKAAKAPSVSGHDHGAPYDFSDLPRMECGLSPEESKALLRAQNGSKWSITAMFAYLAERGHDTHKIWKKIKDLIALTILPISNMLQHRYRASFSAKDDGFGCFELLGFDVMLDHKLVPHLIEVNHSPSFETASPLDDVIKTTVIRDTLRLAGIDADTLIRTAKTHVKVSDDSPAKGWNSDKGVDVVGHGRTADAGAGATKDTSSNKKSATGGGSRQTMLDHRGASAQGLSKDADGASTGPYSGSRGRGRRSEGEAIFLERLRTAYEAVHLGGFERVVPLPPNIDPATRDRPEVCQKWELFQQVGSVQTSLNRSSKTHQNRLAEVQRRKAEREEKQVSFAGQASAGRFSAVVCVCLFFHEQAPSPSCVCFYPFAKTTKILTIPPRAVFCCCLLRLSRTNCCKSYAASATRLIRTSASVAETRTTRMGQEKSSGPRLGCIRGQTSSARSASRWPSSARQWRRRRSNRDNTFRAFRRTRWRCSRRSPRS